jgi:hypothetical protein
MRWSMPAAVRWIGPARVRRIGLARVRWAAPAALAILVACVSRLPRPDYVAQPTAALETVGYPPPPARVEFVPPSPGKGAVWIDGEWVWQGRRWSWRIGRWVQPPPDAKFSPWTVVRSDDGATYYASGTWRDARGNDLPDPTAIITARPNLSDVVDPEGELEQTGRSIKPESGRDAGPDGEAPDAAETPMAADPDNSDAGSRIVARPEIEAGGADSGH